MASGPSWDRHAIIAEIRRRGTTIDALGAAHGYARGTLNNVFVQRWPRGQAIVAHFLERTRHELWPDLYAADDVMPALDELQRAPKAGAA